MYSKYLRLTRPFTPTFTPSGSLAILNVKWENQPSKRWAGHSKWQNIKNTKATSDHNKAVAFQRIYNLIQLAIKQNGRDVSTNPKLRSLLEDAKKISMPKATIERALQVTQTLDKPYWVVFSGPKGVVVAFEVVFTNTKNSYLVTKLGTFTKRIKLKMEPYFSHLCDQRGIIITDPVENIDNAYEKAMEDAIEIGVEEVHESDDKSLIFECAPDRVDSYCQQLVKKGYNIHSSSTELEFKELISLTEEEVKDIEKLIHSVQNQYEEVLRVVYNISKE